MKDRRFLSSLLRVLASAGAGTFCACTEPSPETADTVLDAEVSEILPETTDGVESEADASRGNACGGTAELLLNGAPAELGDVCGCDGEVACDGIDAFRCSGGSPANRCGGCSILEADPGDSCGTCTTWECEGDSLNCQLNLELEGCADAGVTCADLTCSALFRNCDERALGESAICTECATGYRTEGELCVPADCDLDSECPPLATAFSACDWADVCDEYARQTRLVTPRSCSEGVCADGLPVEETVDCERRDTEGNVCDLGTCAGGACVPTPVAPPEPTGLSATDGLSSDAVEIRFSVSAGASSYKLMRDGVELARPAAFCAGSATEICFTDTGAPAPPSPGAPVAVQTSTPRTDFIRITWSPVEVYAGETAIYTAIAVGPSGLESPQSLPDSGYRAALPVLRYQVAVAGTWTDAGLDTAFNDFTAPPDALVGGTVTVRPTGSGNILKVEGITASDGASRTYRVRAVSAAGIGTPSVVVSGWRAAGTINSYLWSRSPTRSRFAPVPDAAATATALDANTDALCAGSSWNYRVSVTSSGGGTANFDSTGTPYCFDTTMPIPPYGICTGEGVSTTCETGYCGNGRCTTPNFQYIPAGSRILGAPPTEYGSGDHERPEHWVELSAFELMRTEVTQAEFFAVAGLNPSYHQTPTCNWNSVCNSNENANPNAPVEDVNWYMALAYANAMSRAAGLDECYALEPSTCAEEPGIWENWNARCTNATLRFSATGCNGYRLPTEAEWEYAVRAGTFSATYSRQNGGELIPDWSGCDDQPALADIAWYCENAFDRPQAVALKSPNNWGLYDMLGNVWEWTWDWYGHYDGRTSTNPLGAETGTSRVCRGGSFDGYYGPEYTRSATRMADRPNLGSISVGFRLARTVP